MVCVGQPTDCKKKIVERVLFSFGYFPLNKKFNVFLSNIRYVTYPAICSSGLSFFKVILPGKKDK